MTDTSERDTRKHWVAPLIVLTLGTFLAVLGSSVINIAIPYIQKDLGVSEDEARWVSTAYLLSLGVAVPLSSWLSARLGLSRTYLASLIVFTVASALCGVAWDITSLISFRVLQAFPGGIITVTAMTLLFDAVPPAKLGVAMGFYGFGVVLAPALGPVFGGWLVEESDWHAVFLMSVPVGVAAIIAAVVVLPRQRPTEWPRFDWLGYGTISFGLIALLLAADRGPDPEWGWTDYRVLMLAVFGTLSLALFVVIDLEVERPLIDLRVFRVRTFDVSAILVAINVIGMYALLYYVPQFLLTVRGYEPFEAGLILVPGALAMSVMGPVTGRLVDRFGPRWPLVIGLALAALGSLLLAQLTVDTPRSDIVLWTTIRNAGVGMSMMPAMSSGLNALPPELVSSGSAMSNTILRVASSLGVAGIGGLSATQHAQLVSDRAILMPTTVAHLPGVTNLPGMTQSPGQTTQVLGAYYQHLSGQATTITYDNAFYLLAVLGAAASVLAFMIPSVPAGTATEQRRDPMATAASAVPDQACAPAPTGTPTHAATPSPEPSLAGTPRR